MPIAIYLGGIRNEFLCIIIIIAPGSLDLSECCPHDVSENALTGTVQYRGNGLMRVRLQHSANQNNRLLRPLASMKHQIKPEDVSHNPELLRHEQ